MRSAILIVVAATLLFHPCTAMAQDVRSDEEVLREIKEVLWPRAYFEQDEQLLASILADEFQMVDDEGNWSTKRDQVQRVRTTKPSYDSLVFKIKRLDVFNNGTAIVAGTGVVTGTDEDGPYTFHYQSTNVLIKRDGAWKAIASHVSGVEQVESE